MLQEILQTLSCLWFIPLQVRMNDIVQMQGVSFAEFYPVCYLYSHRGF